MAILGQRATRDGGLGKVTRTGIVYLKFKLVIGYLYNDVPRILKGHPEREREKKVYRLFP